MNQKIVRIRRIVFPVSIIIVLLVTSACGVKQTVTNVASNITEGFKVGAFAVSKIYTTGVDLEIGWRTSSQHWEEHYSNGKVANSESYAQVQACYPNSADAILKAEAGVFGTDPNGKPRTTGGENSAFINALGVGGSLYAGNIDKCQAMAADLMDQMRATRAESQHDRDLAVDYGSKYQMFLQDTVAMKTINQFLVQYQGVIRDLVAKGETDLGSIIGADPSIKPMPLDFIGFPTDALTIQTKSKALCDTYIALYHSTSTPNGLNPVMYKAEWVPAGYCNLYRQAAYDYMNNIFLSAEASSNMDAGQDTSIFATIVPTPTPKPQ